MEKLVKLITSKEFFSFIGYIAFGFILYFLIKGIANRTKAKNKRQVTIKNLILGIIKYVIIIFIGLICLSILGINVTSFLAGLGIAGVVVGLALQDIMKDVLAGIFIIAEDQFDVGDIVDINGFMGEVISVGIKTTRLKNYEGKIKIISNRNISEVINCSKNNSMAIIDIPISYEENAKHINKTLEIIAKRIDNELEIKKETQILGINNFADSAVIYRIMVEVKPAENFEKQRTMRKIIKEELDKENISIPYNKLEVINGK